MSISTDPRPKNQHDQQDRHDHDGMQRALEQARNAAAIGEVPVGAVLVHQGCVIGTGHNAPISAHDPTAHAEIQALRMGAQHLKNYRLEDCTLYVTLEPCAMCSAALLQARVARVVYGASEPKTGAAGSVINLFTIAQLNHHTHIHGGVLAQECAALLRDFFHQRRTTQRTAWPIRPDALRTPERCFNDALAEPWHGHYLNDLPTLGGLRLHYWHSGCSTQRLWLLLHDVNHWSYALRHLAQALTQAGQRVLVPDLMGFGRSDKPKKHTLHHLDWHAQILHELLQRHDSGVQRPFLVTAQGGDAFVRHLNARCPLAAVVFFLNSVDGAHHVDHVDHADALSAASAPYPDAGHRAGPRALAAQWYDQPPHPIAPTSADMPPVLHVPYAPTHPQAAAALAQTAMEYFAFC